MQEFSVLNIREGERTRFSINLFISISVTFYVEPSWAIYIVLKI